MTGLQSTEAYRVQGKEGCLGRGGRGLTCLCEEFKADSPCPVEVPEQGNGIAEHAFKGADMAEVCG